MPARVLPVVVLLARLVPLQLQAAGQARAALLLTCPTVRPSCTPRTCVSIAGVVHALMRVSVF